MNAPAQIASEETHTIPGTPFQGGFYVGLFRSGGAHYALIVAPKAEGETTGKWSDDYTEIPGANSFCDGMANTIAMAEADLTLGKWARELSINGFSDWYLPSRDELELCYRYLKPTVEENHAWRNGENPSALPVATYPYTEQNPAQTSEQDFQAGAQQAFEDTWHWSSTQYSASHAWYQDFDGGSQYGNAKVGELRARAVRRLLIIQ